MKARALICELIGVAALFCASCSKDAADAARLAEEAKHSGRVACLGKISPADGIISVAQPASSFPGASPIAEISVQEGEMVKKGQQIAVLENRARLETTWQEAAAAAEVARFQREKIKAGGSPAEVAAGRAEVARLRAEATEARLNQGRSETLRKDSAISDVDFEASALALATRESLLEAAEAKLKSLVEVRDIDLSLAEAQYRSAAAEADHAKAELEQAYIRAPMDGQIVRINAHPGESIGPDGVVEFAQIDPLYAFCEADESDAAKVKVGEKATITGSAFADTLTGVVEHVGTRVGRNNLVTTDPTQASDSRIVEVKVRLTKSEVAAHFLGAKVTVVLEP